MSKRTFLDSGVLIAAFQGQREISQRAFSYIDDPGREFVASDFTKLELIPKATYHRNTEELAFYTKYFESVVETVPTTPDHVVESIGFASTYNLAAADALLARAAIRANAVEFVTVEGPTKPLCKIPADQLLVLSIRPPKKEKSFWNRLVERVCTSITRRD